MLFAAGKSMGGRMASRIAARGADLDALVMLGYPLHPAARPQQARVDHFPQIRVPSLFVQGTRDSLCQLDGLRPALATLAGAATLHVVDGGDHSFKVLKRAGRPQTEVDAEVLHTCVDWIDRQAAARGG
jgi:predicted alpha/beta-hydrolase family hydrolase